MTVICVAGARPNFVKIAPVVAGLEELGTDVCFVHTGQHYDQAMSQVFLEELGIRTPDHLLGVGSASHAEQVAAVMIGFEPIVAEVDPRAVVVVGDVNSTVGAAMVAARHGSYVCHVEAGLRSRDWSMPEEINRVVTDRLSDLLLAPSADAVENLRAEGYREDQIEFIGNVMIDTLHANLARARKRKVAERLGLGPRYGVVTLHRPGNVDDPATFEGLLSALTKIGNDIPLAFPAHPRTAILLDGLRGRLGSDQLKVIEPLGYVDFLGLTADAQLVLTDSGGVQEETTVLGVPCLTLRDSTERPITVSEGTNTIVGTNPEAIMAAATAALSQQGTTVSESPPAPAGWDGAAGTRAAKAIHALCSDPSHPRPTQSAS